MEKLETSILSLALLLKKNLFKSSNVPLSIMGIEMFAQSNATRLVCR